jgi:flagellar basal-body rod protein FlgB
VRDLSTATFQERLKEAVDGRDQAGRSMAGGIHGDVDEKMRRVRDSMKDIRYHDQTNINLEQQVNEITKNQMLHNMAVTLMTSQFRLLQTAISERV